MTEFRTNKLQEAQEHWTKKYGHLSPEERGALVKKESVEALKNLKKANVKPTMTAAEVLGMTRER